MTATGHWATAATWSARSVSDPPTQLCPEPITTMEAFFDFFRREYPGAPDTRSVLRVTVGSIFAARSRASASKAAPELRIQSL